MSSELWLAQAVHHASTITLILVPGLARSWLTGCIDMAPDSGLVLTLLCAIRLMFPWTPSCWWRLIQVHSVFWSCKKGFCASHYVPSEDLFYVWDNLKNKNPNPPNKQKIQPETEKTSLLCPDFLAGAILRAYSCCARFLSVSGTSCSSFPWSQKDVLSGCSFSQCNRSVSSLDHGSPVPT